MRAATLEPTHATAEVEVEVGTRYIDADHDGLLDAVEIVERVVTVRDGRRHVLATTRTVASNIGDDGVPHRVEMGAAP